MSDGPFLWLYHLCYFVAPDWAARLWYELFPSSLICSCSHVLVAPGLEELRRFCRKLTGFRRARVALCCSATTLVRRREEGLQGRALRERDYPLGSKMVGIVPDQLSPTGREEVMGERGVTVDHSTLNRWVVKYAPEIEKQCRRRQRAVGRRWRMDESVPRT